MVIGITGIIGSGKSTIANYTKQVTNGILIDTDSLAKELMKPGKEIYKNVVDYFGEDILLENGEIDRSKLSEIVFQNKDKLQKLNDITHSKVIDEVKKIINTEKSNTIILESALLFETELKELCDVKLAIVTSYEEKKRRLMSNRGYSEEKVKNIISSQKTNEEFIEQADVVIENDNLEVAKIQVLNFLKKV